MYLGIKGDPSSLDCAGITNSLILAKTYISCMSLFKSKILKNSVFSIEKFHGEPYGYEEYICTENWETQLAKLEKIL